MFEPTFTFHQPEVCFFITVAIEFTVTVSSLFFWAMWGSELLLAQKN